MQQILRYFDKFKSTNTEDIPAAQLANYAKQFNEFTTKFKAPLQSDQEIDEFGDDVRMFLKAIANDCRAIWAQFDANLIMQGLIFLAFTIVFIFLLTTNLKFDQFHMIFTSQNVGIIYTTNIALAAIVPAVYYGLGWPWSSIDIVRCTSFYGLALMAILLAQNWDYIAANWSTQQHFTNLFTRCVFLVAISAFFSNSFVVYEQTILVFLLSGALIVFVYKIRKEYAWLARLHRLRPEFIFHSSFSKLAAFTIVSIVLLRLSYNLHQCREEHGNCNEFQLNGDGGAGTKLQPGRSKGANKSKTMSAANVMDFLPIVFLAVFAKYSRRFLRKCGNFSGLAPHVMVVRNTSVIAVIACILHFILSNELYHAVRGVSKIYIDACAWTVYILFILQTVAMLWRPLMILIYIKPQRTYHLNPFGRFAPHIVMQMKQMENGHEKPHKDEDIPIVYGLATVYSSAILSMCFGLINVLALLLGSRAANGLFVVLAPAALILILNAIHRYQRSTRLGNQLLLILVFFFAVSGM